MVSYPTAERAEAISDIHAIVMQPRFLEYLLHSRKKTMLWSHVQWHTPVIPAQAGGSGRIAGGLSGEGQPGHLGRYYLPTPPKIDYVFPCSSVTALNPCSNRQRIFSHTSLVFLLFS